MNAQGNAKAYDDTSRAKTKKDKKETRQRKGDKAMKMRQGDEKTKMSQGNKPAPTRYAVPFRTKIGCSSIDCGFALSLVSWTTHERS